MAGDEEKLEVRVGRGSEAASKWVVRKKSVCAGLEPVWKSRKFGPRNACSVFAGVGAGGGMVFRS